MQPELKIKSSAKSSALEKAFDINTKKPDEALQICDEYLKNNPPNNFCSGIQFHAHFCKQNWSEALKKANEVIDHDPHKKMAFINRGRVQYKMGNFVDAANDAQHAIELDDTGTLGSVGHRLAALSYAMSGNLENGLQMAYQIPELDADQWFPPIDPIPAGTKTQFIDMIGRTALGARKS